MRVYIFYSESCGVCREVLFPMMHEILTELTARGIDVVPVQLGSRPYTNRPWDPMRKIQKSLVTVACGTPEIVIEYDVKGQKKRRVIWGAPPNLEDYKTQIVFSIILALLEQYVPSAESRLALMMKAYMPEFDNFLRESKPNVWNALDDVIKTIREVELRRRYEEVGL